MRTIDYTPGLRVSNIDQLPPGAGARYLEALEPHDLDLPLIAVQWRRPPAALPAGHLLIKF